jgi:hypothetical protein
MPNVFISSTNLLPNRDFDQHEVLPFFALNQTGLGGQFVTFLTGAQDPVSSEGYSTSAQVGASYTNIWSPLFGVNRRVRPSTVGDTKWEVAGVTLYTTAVYDENGNKLVNLPYSHTEARGFVQTGQAVPILKRGQLTVFLSQFNGTKPVAGYPIVASGTNGGFACVSPSYATGAHIASTVVGRCISDTGTYNGAGVLGGFAQIEVAV